MTASVPQGDLDSVKNSMNNMYRWTRHVYDATRKYYLLGRDRLINELQPKADEHVIEVGCGTARNLIKMAQKYPGVHFYGFDASEEQLKTARAAVTRAGLDHQIKLAHGYAQNFDPQTLFAIPSGAVDKIVFSYTLSMVPPWQESIEHAMTVLKDGGSMHIVDFGPQDQLPPWFRAFLFWWLDLFGVHYRPELVTYVDGMKAKYPASFITKALKGYYIFSIIRK
jgi:S-adenosylmethionine-diacylgycerolhomoserine-N-methlytransferase